MKIMQSIQNALNVISHYYYVIVIVQNVEKENSVDVI